MRHTLGVIATAAGFLVGTSAVPVEAQSRIDSRTSVSLVTPAAQASAAQLNAALADLREAQERFFAAAGRYTENIKELAGYSLPATHSIVMVTASETEWAAVGTIPDLVGVVIFKVKRAAANDRERHTNRG